MRKWIAAWFAAGTILALVIGVLRAAPGQHRIVVLMVTGIAALLTLAAGLTAQFVGRGSERLLGWAVAGAWWIPGLGHVLLGKWRKGLFFFGLLAATYVFGLWLSGWRSVSFEDNPFYNVGQYGSGLTTLLGWLLGDPKAFPREDLPKSWFDPGLLYVCVAGLLNLVIMISVFDVKLAAPSSAVREGATGADKASASAVHQETESPGKAAADRSEGEPELASPEAQQ